MEIAMTQEITEETESPVTEITVRAVTVRDVVTMSNFVPRAAAEFGGFYRFNQEKFIVCWLDWLRQAPYIMLGAFDGETLVGGIGGSVNANPLNEDVFGCEEFWYVEPTYRNRGTGKLLLDALSAWCKSKGASNLVMNMMPGGHAKDLMAFYKKERFEVFNTKFIRRI
jgi:GNAT superfamily N-acetyltransferase